VVLDDITQHQGVFRILAATGYLSPKLRLFVIMGRLFAEAGTRLAGGTESLTGGPRAVGTLIARYCPGSRSLRG